MKQKGPGCFIQIRILCIIWLVLLLTAGITTLASAENNKGKGNQSQKWWDVPPEDEVPSKHYDSILYSEIPLKLYEIQKNSNRVRVEVIGQSAGGRNLFLVTIAKPGEEGRFGHYKALRKMMLRDPDEALSKLDEFESFKVPVFINGSIHGDEYPGTDACMRLIELLAYENSSEVQAILDNTILLINVVQNPDGRVLGTRRNANDFDINRDMITQSQPESRATVQVIKEWNPMVFLDLHGFIDPMLIEPCTPPHNPNYEYDLYLGWALELAYAMRDQLFDNTEETEVIIPYLNWPDGWDDWPPIYAAMYPMLHGAYGHTLETPHEDERGVDAHFAAVWGALNLITANREDMIRDQIEVYRRGALDLPQVLIPDELLDETTWEQYNELTLKEFPTAFIIPREEPLQSNPVQMAELIDFLIFNGVEVEKAEIDFSVGETHYPAGTYVVWLDQPKRSLANIILEDGMDVSGLTGITFYSPPASWSHPLLWGVTRHALEDELYLETSLINKAQFPKGTMESAKAIAYAVIPDTFQGFSAVNALIQRGYTLFHSRQSFEDNGRTFEAGTIILPADKQLINSLKQDGMMKIYALQEPVEEATMMQLQKIAVYGDEGLTHLLKVMGFHVTEIRADQLNSGVDLSSYDLFAFGNDRWWSYSLDTNGINTINSFFATGGDFIALGNGGSTFANEQNLIDVETDSVFGNGIANIDMATDHPLTAGFDEDEYAFIYNPVWFTSLGENVTAAAFFDAEHLLVSGYLPGWQTSPAAGMPVLVYEENPAEPAQDTIVFGFDATFRGHPKQTAKLIGNAIFSSID